jgi:hypothetical protein
VTNSTSVKGSEQASSLRQFKNSIQNIKDQNEPHWWSGITLPHPAHRFFKMFVSVMGAYVPICQIEFPLFAIVLQLHNRILQWLGTCPCVAAGHKYFNSVKVLN